MNEQRLLDLCKKLKPLIGNKADKVWLSFLTAESPIHKRQAESLIELLAARYLTKKVDSEDILLPPPGRAHAKGDIPLGTLHYGDKELYPLGLRNENFGKHIAICSITGGGKTNVGYILIQGLLKKNIPFLTIDWKRGWRNVLSLPNPDVRKIKVYSVGRNNGLAFNWNPLRGPPGVHPRTWIAIVAEALEKSHISGPGVADIFIDLFDKKMDEYGFYEETVEDPKYPNFFDAKEDLDRVQFKGRRMLWQDSCSRILRTFTFGPAGGAFNARHPIKLEEILGKPVIVELDQELPKPLRVFFTDIVLRWIHLYRLGQGETEQLRHVTFLEEVHNLFPRSNIEKQASNSLENVFREIRGFGEGLVNITQHPSMIPIYILGNCNTQIYLGLQHEDDITAGKRALFLERGEEGILDRLRVGEGIIKIKGRVGACHIKFPLVPISKGVVTDQMLQQQGDVHA